MMRIFCLLFTLLLCACATSTPRTGLPYALEAHVLKIAGADAQACGIVDMGNDTQRLAGFQCVQTALDGHRAFWLADLGGWRMAWAGAANGKVFQLLDMGNGITGAECKKFEITAKTGIHCSI